MNSIYDVLNIIDSGILNNNNNDHYIIFINQIHNFILEGQEIHFDCQFDILEKTNYILTKPYEIDNDKLKNEYYELRGLILNNLDRIQDDKNVTES